MEGIACREGLALSSDLAVRKFRLSYDNFSVVRNIKGGSMGAYGHIVQEINARVGAFVSSEFIHEGRASNVDAHVLARSLVYCEIGRKVWLLSPLEDVCNSISRVINQ